ncbi:MAG: hypothetical protein JWO86_1521 [Myxococcaceae bacterium]|nr:hypothetical protein [Myxococcaceae bacterium]MEA2750424.1 hypothetical protein [Myxococcales bacterium]
MKRSLLISSPLSVAGLFASAAFFVSPDAAAVEFGTKASEHPFRSPQNFQLELRLGPYLPQIDDDPNLHGQTPFAKNFGSNPRVAVGLEFDWQMFRIPGVGTIGPGFSVAYVTMGRDVTTVSGRTSGDSTSLSIYPMTAVAVLRADVFWRDMGIPLVPYGKAGLGLGLWRASNANGTAVADNVSGKGASWGTAFALGVSFALDSIDKGASRNMDNSTGINNTYVFLEASWLALNGLAQSNALHVGTNTWFAGLAFEF